MDASEDPTAVTRAGRWWRSPPRRGLRRFINPWKYRHLRGVAIARLCAGGPVTIAGSLGAAYGAYGWAAFFLPIAALDVAGGCWYLTIARSASA